MSRTWIAIAFAMGLHASVVSAQVSHLTVNTAPATVHKAPSTASPVIGQASRGMALEVTRDVGDWVKIAWSTAPDGIGYVRKSAGTIGVLTPAAATTSVTTLSPATTPASRASAAPAQSAASAVQAASPAASRLAPAPNEPVVRLPPAARPQPEAVPTGYVAMPSHRIGLGGQVGGAAMGGGFSARGWTAGRRLGYQFDVMRYSLSNPVFFTQMATTQVGPKVLYAFRDHVTDRTWLRPYVGGGAHLLRATMSDPVTGVSMSDARLAAQFFAGTEVTLSNLPQLGLSADAGYQWYQNQFAGYSLKGMTVAATAHWYLE